MDQSQTPCEQRKCSKEGQRLEEDKDRRKNWKRWGPYLSERQWGTVREDYSSSGDCWTYLTHDQSRSYAYRWGEDGILGLTDRQCRICFALCLWNGKDPILKERLFGLTGPEANHGEDVKEQYFYLKSTPTHSYMQGLYKYPTRAYPYEEIVKTNKNRNRLQREYELTDTGIFDNNQFFDVFVEYAKADDDDVLIKVTVHNRSQQTQKIHVLPQVWFRNTWAFGGETEQTTRKQFIPDPKKKGKLQCLEESLGAFNFECETFECTGSQYLSQPAKWLFTENDSNKSKLYNTQNETSFVKDAFHEYLIKGVGNAVNPDNVGSKVAAHHVYEIPAESKIEIKMRLYSEKQEPKEVFGNSFNQVFEERIKEHDEYYDVIVPKELHAEEKNVVIQGFAGMLWTKQFYYYVVKEWLEGDKNNPPPPDVRKKGRNSDWGHLFNRDVVSMPDKWEYPWYAVWDLAFHCVTFSLFDIEFAKNQLSLFLREWYMHPSGCLPAYEFNFGDVNPPVHAWACWRVYRQSEREGARDIDFLASCFQKLVINFTWWVNRKDPEGKNIFAGGFLGLDNIGIFDRSQPLPTGGYLQQADGTAWMAFYCIYMLKISMELAIHLHKSYEDMASKFFEHFVLISDAMNERKKEHNALWDDRDGFYYDHLSTPDNNIPLRVRSLVGLSSLFACGVVSKRRLEKLPHLYKRTIWFLQHRKELGKQVTILQPETSGEFDSENPLGFIAIPKRKQIESMLKYLFDSNEFLSDHGIRSLSKYHEKNPYICWVQNQQYRVDYDSGESTSAMFGGNSNWRGPIWMPMNFLVIESLERLDHFYASDLQMNFPTESQQKKRTSAAAIDICERLASLVLPGIDGRRPCNGGDRLFSGPLWKDYVLFYEYFDGDSGRGLGASYVIPHDLFFLQSNCLSALVVVFLMPLVWHC